MSRSETKPTSGYEGIRSRYRRENEGRPEGEGLPRKNEGVLDPLGQGLEDIEHYS